MNTNWRKSLQKGYGKLAFALLIVAMCFTAFIASPFCNTQALAAAVTYDDSGYSYVTDKAQTIGGVEFEQTFTAHGRGTPYYGADDTTGKTKAESDGGTVADLSGFHFAKKYYDFTQLDITQFDRGSLSCEKNLDDIFNNFGIGVGTLGWKKDIGKKNYVEAKVNKKANIENSIKIDITGHNKGDDMSKIGQAWRVYQGVMYTFIKIPKELAPFLTVSVSAKITTPNDVEYVSSLGGDWTSEEDKNYIKQNLRYVPTFDVQIGTKDLTTDYKNDGKFNLTPEFVKNNSKTHAQYTGNGTDSASTAVKSTSSVSFADKNDSSEWIKINFGVMTTKSNFYHKGLSTDNYYNTSFAVSDVKLTFTLNPPRILNVKPQIEATNVDRIVNTEIAFIDKFASVDSPVVDRNKITKYIGDNKAWFSFRLYDTKTNKFLKEPNNQDKDFNIALKANETNESAFTFTVPVNGEFRMVLFHNQSDTHSVQIGEIETSRKLSIKKIDKVRPNTPDINLTLDNAMKKDKYGHIWLHENDVNNALGIAVNTDDAQGVGLQSILVSFYKLDKQDEFFSTNINKDANPSIIIDPNILLAKGLLTKYTDNSQIEFPINNSIVSLSDFKLDKWAELPANKQTAMFHFDDVVADFFTNASYGYGTYQVVFASVDKAGNVSEFRAQKVNYDNGEPYDLTTTLKFSKNISQNNYIWESFDNYDSWLTDGKNLNIKFSIPANEYYFPKTFRIQNDDGRYILQGGTINPYEFTMAQETKSVDGLQINKGEYYLSIPVADLDLVVNNKPHTTTLYVSDGSIYFEGVSNVESACSIKIDKGKPFEGVNVAEMFKLYNINETMLSNINSNYWYTYANNEAFRENNTVVDIFADDHKGLYFEIDANNEFAVDYLQYYSFKIGENPIQFEVSSNDPNKFIVFVPYDNMNDAGQSINLKIYDQTGINFVDIAIPTLKFDGRVYNLESIQFNHLDLENNFITFWEVLSNETKDITNMNASQIIGKDYRQISGAELIDIANYNFRRGAQIIIKVDSANQIYEYINDDTIIKDDKLAKLAGVVPDKNNNNDLFSISSGNYKKDGSILQKIAIELGVYKNVEIDLYDSTNDVKPLLETQNSVLSPHFRYNGNKRSFIVKTRPASEADVKQEINVGVEYDAIADALLKNANSEGQPITVSVKDPSKMLKTKGKKTFYLYIDKKEVYATVSGLDIKTDEQGHKYLSIQYADDTKIKVEYLNPTYNIVIGEESLISMVLGVKKNTDYIPLNQLAPTVGEERYNIEFYNEKNNGADKNYKFTFKATDGSELDLKLEVSKRNVSITLQNQGFKYGGPFAVNYEGATLTGVSASLKKELGENYTFIGDVLLKTADGNNITANSPVYNNFSSLEKAIYHYEIANLAIKGFEEKIQLNIQQKDSTFELLPRPITFENNCVTTFEYGYKFNYLDPAKLNFAGFVLGDDKMVILKDLTYVIKDSSSTVKFTYDSKNPDKFVYLDAVAEGNEYKVEYSWANESEARKKLLSNYVLEPVENANINNLLVNKKNITVSLDHSKSIYMTQDASKLGKDSNDNITVEGVIAFVINYAKVEAQMIGNDYTNYQAVITAPANWAFTIDTVGFTGGKKAITARPDYNTIITNAIDSSLPKNYNFIVDTEGIMFEIVKLNDGEYRVEFNKAYYNYIYSTLRDNTLLSSFANELQTNMSLVDNKGATYLENNGELEWNDLKKKLSVYFKDVSGVQFTIDDLANKPVGRYTIFVYYKADVLEPDRTVIINTNASNTTLEITPKEIQIKLKSGAQLSYEFGKEFTETDLNNIFVADGGKLVGNLVLQDFDYVSTYDEVGSYNILYQNSDGNLFNYKASFENAVNADNYILHFPEGVKISITKKVVTLTIKNNVKEYDGTNIINNPTFNVNGIVEGFDCQFDNAKLANLASKDVGTYDITVLAGALTDTEHYMFVDGPIVTNKYKINPRVISITSININNNSLDKVFDNTNSVLNMSVIGKYLNLSTSDQLPNIADLINAIANIHYQSVNVGTQPITIEFDLAKLAEFNNDKATNYQFNLNTITLNGTEVNKEIANSKLIVKDINGNITQAKLNFIINDLSKLSKEYDGTPDFELIKTEIDNSTTTEAIKNLIVDGNVVYEAKFNKSDISANTLNLSVKFNLKDVDFINITKNINIQINGVTIDKSELKSTSPDAITILQSKSATITPRIIRAIEELDATGEPVPSVVKVYDKNSKVTDKDVNIKFNVLPNDIKSINIEILYDNFVIQTLNNEDNYVEKINAGIYKTVPVPVRINSTSANYVFEHNTKLNCDVVYVTAQIKQKTITVNIIDNSQFKISKVYDGTRVMNVNLKLPRDTYDWNKEDVVGNDGDYIDVMLDGEILFSDQYAGIKNIEVNGARTIQAENVDNEIFLNYTVNPKIVGLTGTITPRPIEIDTAGVYINNTRYYGPNGKDYTVVNTPKKEINKIYQNTVKIYMPISAKVGDIGILPIDADFNLSIDIDMLLDDSITGWLQHIRRKDNGKAGLKANSSLPNANSVSASYKIVNLSNVFQGGNGNLIVGTNDTGNINDYAQVHIQQFEITDDNIYFETGIIEKVYDGTKNLTNNDANPILAKVGIKKNGVFVKSFLSDDIMGIPVSGQFSHVNAYEYTQAEKLNITLSKDIQFGIQFSKLAWYKFADNFNFNRNDDIYGRITKRPVRYIFTPKNKVYDGTTNAESFKNYTFVIDDKSLNTELDGIIKDEENLIGHLTFTAKYTTFNVGETGLQVEELAFSKQAGQNYRPELVFTNDSGVKEYAQSHIYEGVSITPKDLTVKIGDLNLKYMDELPLADVSQEIKNYIDSLVFEGFVDKDNTVANKEAFANEITYVYTNKDYGTKIKVLNVGKYNDILMVVSDKARKTLPNYKIVVQKGTINVAKRIIKVEINDTSKLFGYYGVPVDVNTILNNITFKCYDSIYDTVGKALTTTDNGKEIEKLKKFIIINNLPSRLDNVGYYELGLDTHNFSGVANYEQLQFVSVYTFEVRKGDISYACKDATTTILNGKEVPYFEFPFTNENYLDYLLSRFYDNENLGFNNYIDKELYEHSTGNKVTELKNINAYNDYYIKLTAKYVNEVGNVVENNNYNVKNINISIKIIGQPIEFVMADAELTYNNEYLAYDKNLTGLETSNQDKISLLYLVKEGNGFRAVTAPKDVGKYYVVAYSQNEQNSIKSIDSFNIDEINSINGITPEIKSNLTMYGTAYAILEVQKIRVKNIGTTYFNIVPEADTSKVYSQIKAALKFNNPNISAENNVDFIMDKNGFNKGGVVNISIQLIGVDNNNVDTANYVLDNSSLVVNVVTSSISSKDKSVTISTTDSTNLRADLVQVGIYTRPQKDADELASITGNISLIGNVDYMVFAQFKKGYNNSATAEEIENSASIKLGNTVKVKVKVDSVAKGKELFVVNENGLCKKINDVNFVDEGGETYAEFTTNELGWLVFGKSPAQNISAKTIAMIVVSSLVLAGIVGYFIYLIIKIKKGQKAE